MEVNLEEAKVVAKENRSSPQRTTIEEDIYIYSYNPHHNVLSPQQYYCFSVQILHCKLSSDENYFVSF